ncbi:MAG: nucleotidyltransferase family protein [Gemmatimonadetes bacterium]|nr:nucleotidyltransferase family protein [Gemmatimonadota bacterium]
MSEEDVDAVAPLLLASGAAGLAWWRIRSSDLPPWPAVAELRDAYRLYTLHAALHEQDIRCVVDALRADGIDPVLIKGWAIARLYPEPGLRPYGDLDFVVSDRQRQRALGVIQSLQLNYPVDLDHRSEETGKLDADDLIEDLELVRLGDTDVRVPILEDHLKLLCLHLFRHGAITPPWLCDIALVIENYGPALDWDRVLGRDPWQAGCVVAAIRLAGDLLGAAPNQRFAQAEIPLPKWLKDTTLREWGTPLGTRAGGPQVPFGSLLGRPGKLIAGLRERWPNPISATMDLGARFDGRSRLPLQLRSFFRRGRRLVTGAFATRA